MFRLLILTDGGTHAGMGHIVRLKPIVQELSALNIKCDWKINGDSSVMKLFSNTEHVEIVDWTNPDHIRITEQNYPGVLIDSLHMDRIFADGLKTVFRKVIAVIDGILPKFDIDLNIDWSIKSHIENLESPAGSHVLSGVNYTPLRPIFKNPPPKKIRKEVENVLLTLGGSDVRNLTPELIRHLLESPVEFKQLDVIIGPGFSDETKKNILNVKNKRVQLHITPEDKKIFELMSAADLAIAAGGHTIYELAAMGVPTVHILVVENQLYDAPWESIGFTCLAGMWDNPDFISKINKCLNYLSDRRIREQKAITGQSLIKGNGAALIAKEINNLLQGS